MVALAGVSAFLGVDSLLARHYLSKVDAGYYVAAATAARVALFLPGAVAMTVFPRLAAARGMHRELRRLLADALALTALLSGGAAAVIAAFPHLVITVLFGSAYQPAAGPLALLSAAAAAMGLASVLVYFFLAERSVLATSCWVAVALLAAVVVTVHQGLDTIAWMTLVVTASMTAVMGAAALGQRHPERRVARRGRREGSLGLPGAPVNSALAGGPPPPRRIRSDTVLDGPAAVDLTVVVPSRDAGERLRTTVEELVAALRATGSTFEVVVVSDGSIDGSDTSLVGVAPDVVHPVALRTPQGKGEALRVGLSRGRGRYLGFIDGDGDLSSAQVGTVVALARDGAPDMVVAGRCRRRSDVAQPSLRRVSSWLWRQAVLVLFWLPARHTQTGLKLVRRDVLADVLPRMVERRDAFDLELLVVARRLGHRRVLQAPVRGRRRLGSSLPPAAAAGTIRDLLTVFYRLRVLHHYDGEHHAAAVSATAEQTHTEPAYHEPAHTGLASSEPTHSEPARADPTHIDPPRTEQARTEPAHTEPAHHEPAHTEPTHCEPARAGLASSEPAHREQAADQAVG